MDRTSPPSRLSLIQLLLPLSTYTTPGGTAHVSRYGQLLRRPSKLPREKLSYSATLIPTTPYGAVPKQLPNRRQITSEPQLKLETYTSLPRPATLRGREAPRKALSTSPSLRNGSRAGSIFAAPKTDGPLLRTISPYVSS